MTSFNKIEVFCSETSIEIFLKIDFSVNFFLQTKEIAASNLVFRDQVYCQGEYILTLLLLTNQKKEGSKTIIFWGIKHDV